MTIRTRFAPSPTGMLHIGGVRTALFNWLLTRRLGGEFVLRIDDTDVGRNQPEALQPILDGFRWLGLTWDEGPEVGGPHASYFQSERSQSYIDAARQLLDSGHAYPAYETPDELKKARESADAEKRNFVYRGPHRDTPPDECRKMYDANPAALRFKIPAGRLIAIDDLIRGRVEWQSDLISDPIILRPDGRPLYNFATVVDDAAMNITHVIRAVEHLSNTPAQIFMYDALGFSHPFFAHVPLVNEPNSNKKLSKRRIEKFMTKEVRAKLSQIGWSDEEIDNRPELNPVTVNFYRELGYLPSAVVNYLGRLGWSLDDQAEFIPLNEMIAHFSLDRVNNAPASFDPQKLLWLAGEYMKELPVAEKVAGVLPFLQRVGLVNDPIKETTQHKIHQIVEAAGERLKIFSDILTHAPAFLLANPEYETNAVQKRLKKEGAVELLVEFRNAIVEANPFAAENLEPLLGSFCDARGLKKNALVQPLRVAVTGSEVGLGLYETLEILGRDETLRRIDLGAQLAKSA